MKYVIANPLAIHEIGQRTNQEDSLFPIGTDLNDSSRLFILCDGMGGHDSGEVASSTVCETMGAFLTAGLTGGQLTTGLFEQALNSAYDALDAKDDPMTVKKMGTTMTFLCFHSAGVTAAHMGDSRIYQIRSGESRPVFKTYDHSLINDLIRIGEMTEEEARTSQNRNVITRAMQPNQERRSKADIRLLTDVRPGDWFYMCSDGMLEQMEDSEIISILTDSSKSDEEKRQTLIEQTAGNKDNHTAFLIHVLDVSGQPEPPVADESEQIPVVTVISNEDEAQAAPTEVRASSNDVTGHQLSGIPSKVRLAIAIAALALAICIVYLITGKNRDTDPKPVENRTEQPKRSDRSSSVKSSKKDSKAAPVQDSDNAQHVSATENDGKQNPQEEIQQPSLAAEYFNDLPAETGESPQNNLFY